MGTVVSLAPSGYDYEGRQQAGPSTELGVDRVQNWFCTPQQEDAPSSIGKPALGEGLTSLIYTSVWASRAV